LHWRNSFLQSHAPKASVKKAALFNLGALQGVRSEDMTLNINTRTWQFAFVYFAIELGVAP
jgi:hypothetical protein